MPELNGSQPGVAGPLALVQEAYAAIGYSGPAVTTETVVADLGLRLLLAEQLEASSGRRINDLDLALAMTVGELMALLTPATRRPAPQAPDEDEGEGEES